MANYATISGKTRKTRGLTPQTKAISGRETEMTENPGGGVSFKLDDFSRLNRFIILGVEGNTYYQSQKTLVDQNVECIERCLIADGKRVVDMVVDISTQGRAFKQDAGLFVLASAAAFTGQQTSTRKSPPNPNRFKYQENYEKALADWEASEVIVSEEDALEIRRYALSKLSQVARTGYALYMFAEFVKGQRGFGRSLRRAFANWLTKKPVDKLAYQAWKYKNRNGWSMKDIMRLSHPVTDDPVRAEIFTYMARPDESALRGRADEFNGEIYRKNGKVRVRDGDKFAPLRQIEAAEELLSIQGSTKADIKRAVNLITDFRLTHEAVPTQLRKSPEVWDALSQDMPIQAAISNLGVMTSVGLIKPLSKAEKRIVSLLGNAEAIERSKAHPMRFFIASKVYGHGRGIRGNLTWGPSQNIIDALDGAYYAAFGNVETTGKNIVIAVDDSGSMGGSYSSYYWRRGGCNVGTVPNTTPAEVAAAMALVTYRTEPNSVLIGFADSVRSIDVSRRARISSIVRHIGHGGGTNTSLPIQYAWKNKLDVDGIVSYTDNCTWGAHSYNWHGGGHVTEWVKKYVDRYGPMRFINCAVVANGITDTDPGNPYMFELAGLDANTPRIISEFLQGNL